MSRSPERSEGEAKGLATGAHRCFASLSMTTHDRCWSLKFIIGGAGIHAPPTIWPVLVVKVHNRGPTPFKIDTVLICQRLSLFFAAGDHTAALEAEPVDATDDKEDNQRELKNWYIPNEIEHRDGGPGCEDQV